MSDLVKRLRLMSPDLIGNRAADALEQQAATIERLKAERERIGNEFAKMCVALDDLASAFRTHAAAIRKGD